MIRTLGRLQRKCGFGLHVLEMNLKRPRLPLKINFALTYRCQYKCKTCNIWQLKPANELTTDELLCFIDRNDFVRWVDLTGGEIFLRPDIDEIFTSIALRWKRLAVLHFPTNGYLTERIVTSTQRLASSNSFPIVVTVSLDGPEKLNDTARGVAGGYRRQIETFRRLRCLDGVKAVLGLTLSSLNAGFLRETLAAVEADCPGFTADELHVNIMQVSSHYYQNDEVAQLKPSREQALQDLSSHRERCSSTWRPSVLLERRFVELAEVFLSEDRTPIPCFALRASCFIDPWGTVFPCITYDRQIGNLRETGMDLKVLWRRAAVALLQRQIERGDCPQCWTACEAYQSILGNLLRGSRVITRKGDDHQPT